MSKIKVIHFLRKPRQGFNFSIESIFENIRYLLRDKVWFCVVTSSSFNDGYFSKFRNIIEAGFRQKKNSVLHITGETHFLDFFMRKRNVLLTIHDCRYMERKKGIAKKIVQWLYLKAPVKKAAYVTTVSLATKKEVIHYTGCDSSKISVIPVPINAHFKPSPKIFNTVNPIILQVGAGENKNLERLADALKNISCSLVIIGKPSEMIIQKLITNHIHFSVKNNLSNEDLYTEYLNCDMVSFVSISEGFGMPIIEANSVERAVITSNISSMPEVANNAACLVNPFDVNDVRSGILKIINDDLYRNQLIENGKKNKLRFNAECIAEAYYNIYKKIAAQIND